MILVKDDLFVLETEETTYAFSKLPSGHLEHLYYGTRINLESSLPLQQKNAFIPGNTIQYGMETPSLALENMCLELGTFGKGDIREPAIEVIFENGSRTLDMVYVAHEISDGKAQYEGLPTSYGSDSQVQTLVVTLKDSDSGLTLDLYYHVFEQTNVITRSSRILNTTEDQLILNRLMSMQLDLDHTAYSLTTFTGAWAREMEKKVQPCVSGMYVNSSVTGVSSNRANPFFMLSHEDSTEVFGACFGFNLVYSGNHYSAVQVSSHNKLRVVSGINPTGFQFCLEPGSSFQSPEAVMTFSNQGHEKLSHNLHNFVKNHIVRGHWKEKERPILINSWEATYFDFNEKKLLKLAQTASKLGVELFVLDDGWFGNRNNDQSSLGDWFVNEKKLPGGLKRLSERVHELGMQFGIWVEPEMVNQLSSCFEAHPEWAVRVPDRAHSLGRNQMLLDLSNPQVQSYIIDAMSAVFSSAKIEYVKWDMNRIVSDAFSPYLSAENQGAFYHAYVLGLYKVLDALTSKFPEILFEGCASGGNRFDLGMLCYMPQNWASDNTDAISRLSIQDGYSYGYPVSTMGAHVSDCPNHQTLRTVPLETRFNVAAFGVLGYECNLTDFDKESLDLLKIQIDLYKKWRQVFQFGDFYRIHPFGKKGWMMVSKDKKHAVAGIYEKLTSPNSMDLKFKGRGLNLDYRYKFYSLPFKHNVKKFGDLINMVSPVHIKNGSVLQDVVSKVYKLSGETEYYELSGALIVHAGIKLKQGFMGMGFNEDVRLFQDFDSRLYFMEAIEECL